MSEMLKFLAIGIVSIAVFTAAMGLASFLIYEIRSGSTERRMRKYMEECLRQIREHEEMENDGK